KDISVGTFFWASLLDILDFLTTVTENSTADQCYRAHSHSSVLQGLPFGGIPTVLAINVVLWLFLLLVFSCLRKAAWDYGRLALLMENDRQVQLNNITFSLSHYLCRNDEIRSKCGMDAIIYLSFQRHIILLMTVVCLLSLAIILPINVSGNLLGDNPQNFGRTTVANVPARNSFLWLHSIFTLLYFVITVLCMAHHSSQLEYREDEKVARTLMITSIPRELSDPGLVTKHLHEAYPSCTVTDIRFCFDVHKLMKLDSDRRKAMKGRLYFTTKAQKEGRIMIKTHPCAQFFCCDFCGFEQFASDLCMTRENLSVCGSRWWLRCVLLNILLFLLLFFLTTPAIIVNTMDKFNVTRPVESLQNPVVTQFFPTLLLWAFSVLLPFVVYYSAFFECHWTRSSENQTIMHKCFLLLVFMVIILPSLGLSSLDVFFRWLFDVNFLDERGVKCVFLPDNGAFFVNYVITSSLMGTAMELLRIPALFVYTMRLCFAKSKAEQIHVKRSQAYEFQFGLEYAWTMCIFSVTMTYSITCPLIVPFGLLYLVLKHMVDRYNIYYAYLPTKLNQRIHSAAVSQVVVAPILCMFWLLFFSILRLGTSSPVHSITLFTFVSLLLCIVFTCFRLCLKKLQPDRLTSYQVSL
uniref:Transmembrane protein 63C n=1 Tax=Denticeps clupeoides TaxID=299321 RepID=A0AAY4AFL1_9TELE